MKIYHVETQEDYDALMVELEEKGHKLLSGDKPTSEDYWSEDKEDTCITISGKDIIFDPIEWHKKEHPDIQIIEYKAKGENMAEEEMKQNIFDWAKDVAVAVEPFARDIKFEMKKSTVEADLKEAKSSAKKLIENIDEYLENLKPKFKVGDYATVDVNGRKIIAKIDALRENNKEAHGLWYDKTKVNVKQDYWFLAEGNKFRHATTEEIAEYEVALNFHKHGRKPFELKRGDVVYLKGYDKNIFLDSGNIYKKHNFIDGDAVLVKTVEEVNEWLENK